jgi:hypothetical protein
MHLMLSFAVFLHALVLSYRIKVMQSACCSVTFEAQIYMHVNSSIECCPPGNAAYASQ